MLYCGFVETVEVIGVEQCKLAQAVKIVDAQSSSLNIGNSTCIEFLNRAADMRLSHAKSIPDIRLCQWKPA